MKLLYYLTDLFVDVFGITRPTDANKRRAAMFILALLLLTIVVVIVAGVVLHSAMK